MDGCIFCKIAKGEIPCAKVYEDDEIIAFLDISPANKGHTLIVPKDHHELLDDVPVSLSGKLMEVVRKLVVNVKKASGCEGYNILMNNGKVSGQEVAHAHIHIIPKFSSDDFKFKWTHKEYSEGEMDKFKEKIKL